MHNLSPGLLSCLQEEAGRGKGANARLPALLLANAGNRTEARQNVRAPELSPERHPHSPRASAGVAQHRCLTCLRHRGDTGEVTRGQKGFPEPEREVAAEGWHLPAGTHADPAAAAEKNFELLQRIS